MRIVIELTRNVDPKADSGTAVQTHAHAADLWREHAGAGGWRAARCSRSSGPLHLFIEHRREIVRRRSEYDLARAKERAHILEGLLIALANLDEVIATIRRSPDTDTARDRLMNKFKLSEDSGAGDPRHAAEAPVQAGTGEVGGGIQ